jgi:copper chaperone CopZ
MHRAAFFAAALVLGIAVRPAEAGHDGHPADAPTAGVVESSGPAASGAGETVTIQAQGLVCDFCARAMEKVLLKRPEVAGIAVDLTAKRVVVRLKPGAQLDDPTLKSLVETSGYSVAGITRQSSD